MRTGSSTWARRPGRAAREASRGKGRGRGSRPGRSGAGAGRRGRSVGRRWGPAVHRPDPVGWRLHWIRILSLAFGGIFNMALLLVEHREKVEGNLTPLGCMPSCLSPSFRSTVSWCVRVGTKCEENKSRDDDHGRGRPTECLTEHLDDQHVASKASVRTRIARNGPDHRSISTLWTQVGRHSRLRLGGGDLCFPRRVMSPRHCTLHRF